MPAHSLDWLQAQPEIRAIRTAACDLNGVARGKRLPVSAAASLVKSGARFPFSALNLDIRGEDIEESPLVFETGDRDAVLFPTERGFVPVPWLETPSAFLPIWMFHEDGRPFEGDPRHALARITKRYRDKGLTPVVAVELEFYLVDDEEDQLRVPVSPRSGRRRAVSDVLSLRPLEAFDDYLNALYDACEAMDIPADAAISEAGPGQFEINLNHQTDPLKAADDAWLFKMLVKGLARQHGFAACFMAKPYPEAAGSGLHAHCSVLDAAGQNIFDDGGPKGSAALRHAIGGCLEALPGCALIFAPHPNSYDRLVPGAHAPSGISWAMDNRTVAVRVPGGSPAARRFEHRVAGGDVNPYLALAAILGAALDGIERRTEPPAPITGNAYDQDLPHIARTLDEAVTAFETSEVVARLFDPELIRNMVLTKRQEIATVTQLSDWAQLQLYLESV